MNQQAATAPELGEKKQNTKSAASYFVTLGILLSRVLGLVRETVFAHYLGNSPAAGAFRAALRIPNFLQNLFGEGVLSASFVPVYTRLRASGDHETARQLASVVGSVLALTVSIFVLTGVTFSSVLVDLIAPGFRGELRELTIQIVRILFPGVGLLVLSAWCLGILNSHRRFFLSYVAPVFWNLAMIGTLFLFGESSTRESLVIALAWGSVLGSALQFGVQVPFVFQAAGKIRPMLQHRLPSARTVFRNFTPVLISRGVVQVSAFIDGMIASFLGAAAVASLAYAQTLYLLPISLFGMAVAAAELPDMSENAGEKSETAFERLRDRIRNGCHRIAFFVIPSCFAFIVLGREVITLIFQSGEFGSEDTLYVWYILGALAIGLMASTWGRLYASAFYALGDTRTPLRLALIRVTVSILLGFLLAFPLRPYIVEFFTSTPGLRKPELPDIELGLGAIGLSLATAISGWVEFLILKGKISKRIGRPRTSKILLTKTVLAALCASIIAASSSLYFDGIQLGVSLKALMILVIYGAGYLIFAAFLKIDEIHTLLMKLKRRLN